MLVGERGRGAHVAAIDEDDLCAPAGHDVGRIVLADAGVARGRVLDEEGAPIAGALVKPREGKAAGKRLAARTGPDGHYELAHLPAGRCRLGAWLTGFSATTSVWIDVTAGTETAVPVLVLDLGPRVTGMVVDENGAPVAGARLNAAPSLGGTHARATTAADGRFALHCPDDSTYHLEVRAEGHVPWGLENEASSVLEVGARDVEIVLASLAPTRFVVVDAASGALVERFGFELLENRGSGNYWSGSLERPSSVTRPGGTVDATARPGVDAYLVTANDYEPTWGDVAHDVAGVRVQTVRLRRGARVSGHVYGATGPAIDAAVSVTALDANVPTANWHSSATPVRTAEDGAFALTGVAAGSHCVTIRPKHGAPLLVHVMVEDSRDVDLGELFLLNGATLEGRLLVSHGVRTSGIDIICMSERWNDLLTTTTDRDGRFRFEDVPAGTHQLWHGSVTDQLDFGTHVEVTVEPGETREVTLDARDRTLCAVDLLVLVNGRPAEGVRPVVTPTAHSTRGLGRCDGDGRVTGYAVAGPAAQVAIELDDDLVVHPEFRLDLPPLGRVEATVEFELGDVVVELAEGTALPGTGLAILRLGGPGRSGESDRSAEIAGSSAGARTLRFANLPRGVYAFTLDVIDLEQEPLDVAAEGELPWTSLWRKNGSVTIRAGETVRVPVD